MEGKFTLLEPRPYLVGRRMITSPQQPSSDTAKENLQNEWNLQTTSYFDRRYYTASYFEAVRCALGTKSRVTVHIKGTSERTFSDHRHPSACDVRSRTSIVPPQSLFLFRCHRNELFHNLFVKYRRLLTLSGN